jgi:hypothetical protein
MAIESVDARYERGRIEVGLFDGKGEYLDGVRLTRRDALELRKALAAALRQQSEARARRGERLAGGGL